MLSRIENGVAFPSLETLNYIAKGLKVPAEYLLSDDESFFFHEKKEAIDKITEQYIPSAA